MTGAQLRKERRRARSAARAFVQAYGEVSCDAHLGYVAGCLAERVAAGGASPLAAQAPAP